MHRKCLKWSMFFSCIFIALYSIFEYVSCLKCSWISDISLAACGSAFLLIPTSVVGYITEKRRTQERIIKESNSFLMADYIVEENGELSKQSLFKITKFILNNLERLHSELKNYYDGCICKDCNLKQLINNEIIPYAEKVANFKVLLADPNSDSKQITEKFNDLMKIEQELTEKIDQWMKENGFILGEEFKVEKNQEI